MGCHLAARAAQFGHRARQRQRPDRRQHRVAESGVQKHAERREGARNLDIDRRMVESAQHRARRGMGKEVIGCRGAEHRNQRQRIDQHRRERHPVHPERPHRQKHRHPGHGGQQPGHVYRAIGHAFRSGVKWVSALCHPDRLAPNPLRFHEILHFSQLRCGM
jgi:hypothetical protein